MITKTLSTRRYKAGYEIRTEEWRMFDDDEPTIIKAAYTPDGCFIGNSKDAYRICVKHGIKPELRTGDSTVCSIGFSERDQKWYGWSHRAIHGFGIGDIVEEGDCTASSGWTEDYLAEHPDEDKSLPIGFVAKDIDDAKQMAMTFAESVS